MGTWGYKTFENDGAADWLYDLEEANASGFLFNAIKAVIRSKRKVDLDDAIEGLAAAEVLCAARYEPPLGAPRAARGWIRRVALVPRDRELKMAIRAVTMIERNSELADSWKGEGKLPRWKYELQKLSKRLVSALREPLPIRNLKPKVARENTGRIDPDCWRR